jgi:hypothetical protein
MVQIALSVLTIVAFTFGPGSLRVSSEMSSQIPAKRLLPVAAPLNAYDGSGDNNIPLSAGPGQSCEGSSHPPRQKQKRIACKDCRQAKVRIHRVVSSYEYQ